MNVTVNFRIFIKHRKEAHRRNHLRTKYSKKYRMKIKPKLGEILTIDKIKYKVVEFGTNYSDNKTEEFIGVVNCQTQ